jgi:hypothetical protein
VGYMKLPIPLVLGRRQDGNHTTHKGKPRWRGEVHGWRPGRRRLPSINPIRLSASRPLQVSFAHGRGPSGPPEDAWHSTGRGFDSLRLHSAIWKSCQRLRAVDLEQEAGKEPELRAARPTRKCRRCRCRCSTRCRRRKRRRLDGSSDRTDCRSRPSPGSTRGASRCRLGARSRFHRRSRSARRRTRTRSCTTAARIPRRGPRRRGLCRRTSHSRSTCRVRDWEG